MQRVKSNNLYIFLVVLTILGFALFLVDIFLGSVNIPIKNIANILFFNSEEKESWELIILHSRLPKALAAILCGAALSVSGLKMQSLFKNPLAGPYILGISSGAGLGVAIFIMGVGIFGISLTNYPVFSNYGLLFSSIIGSSFVLMILLAAIIRIKDIMTVLILGIMIGSIVTAIISIIQYFSPNAQLKSFVLWTMGDLSSVSLAQLQYFAPTVIIGLIGSFFLSKKLNLYLLGEEYAKSLGLNVKQTQFLTIIITAILAGSVTAYCGPIGFIGIVVPHFARLISKSSDHKKLIPLSVLLGINVLLLADIISSLPGSDNVLPINAITSFIGIPFIIWIIFKNKKMTSSI
jgi:iron complex transport system permease protein